VRAYSRYALERRRPSAACKQFWLLELLTLRGTNLTCSVRCAKYVPVASADGRDVLLSMRTAHALRRARPGGKNQRRIADLPYLCLQVLFVRAVPVARDTRHSSCTWLLLLFSISEFVDWGYRASGRTLFMIQFVEVNACRTSEDDNNARKGHAGQKANRRCYLPNK
jgi:hypothetical protein